MSDDKADEWQRKLDSMVQITLCASGPVDTLSMCSDEVKKMFEPQDGWPRNYMSHEPLLAELIVQIRQLNETLRAQNKKTGEGE